jgi:hypothetical protein
MAFGVPGGPKPPKARRSPFWIYAAASCAVIRGNFMYFSYFDDKDTNYIAKERPPCKCILIA